MRMLKLFAKYAIGSILSLIVGFLATMILTRLIPTEEMGKYSMYITVGSLISSLMYLGLDQSYVRFYYDESESSRTSLLLNCIKYPLVFTTLISALIVLNHRVFSNYIIGDNSVVLSLLFCIYLLGLVIDRFVLLKVRMAQKAIAYSLLNVIRKVSYLVLAIVFYFSFFRTKSWTLIIPVTIAEIIVIFSALYVEHRNLKILSKSLKTSSRQLFKYGLPFVFSTTITIIFHSTDKFMLKSLTDYNQIGLYSGAQNIVSLLTQVQNVFSTFWVPVAFEHYIKYPEQKEFFIKVNKIVSYCMIILYIVILCSKDIIIHFLGHRYYDAAFIFPFLAFMPIMYTVSETTVLGINFEKKSIYHVIISLICAIVNAFGNYYLIREFGATGAAISTGLSYILFFGLRTFFANKVYKVKYAIGRFSISCFLVAGLALAACFYHVTIRYILLSSFIAIIVTFLYKDIMGEIKGMINTFDIRAYMYDKLNKN